MTSARLLSILSLALSVVLVAGCDSDEDPATDMSSDMEADVESCPADGATLQVAPIIATLNAVQAGETTSQILQVNNGGDGQLCFGSSIATFDPAVDGLSVGELLLDGSPVTALNPGQTAQLELSFTPTESGMGSTFLTITSDNGGEAEVEVQYEAERMMVDVDPIGNLVTNVQLGHSLDPSRWDEPGYRDDNEAEMMTAGAFNGVFGGDPVPSIDATEIRVYAFYDEATGDILIRQEGYAETVWMTPEARPFVAVHLPGGTYATGGTLNTDPTLGAGTGLAVILSLDPNSGTDCVSAIALGELQLTTVEEDPIDGGISTLQVRSGVLDIFNVDDTPFGDLGTDVESYGYSLCN